MQVPDLINGAFELFGGALSALNIRRLYRDKTVRGFSPTLMAFVTVWGYWNLYYYPHLSQWLSFTGGILLVASNTTWLALCFYYLRHPLPTIHYGGPYDYDDIDEPPKGEVRLDPEMQRRLRDLIGPELNYSDAVNERTVGYGQPFNAEDRPTHHEGDSRRRDR